ncbi:MAG: (deoxy)nucleoside triphosphate pyrophosphohydrolase [Sphingomonadales bacterium]|nr:(deoxy)nucleoside triphosphate pyrophosphohydrolase [Sphingomonadales bacterium]
MQRLKQITVVAAVVERDGAFLCVQRGAIDKPYLSEKWEFPGGKIEAGETETETLAREMKEELSMSVLIGRKLIVVNHLYPDFRLCLHVYLCTSRDEPQLHEHLSHLWLPGDALMRLDWAEADLPIAKRLMEGVD